MTLGIKMFDTLGAITVVTPPSMMRPEKLSFTIVYLQEKEKNQFAKALNELFPNDNITIFMFDALGMEGWLQEAMAHSKYVIIDKEAPLWVAEMAPEKKTYHVSSEKTIEETFKQIQNELKPNV